MHAAVLVKLLLFVPLLGGFDVAGGLGLWVGQIKEVNVGLHITAGEQLNADGLRINLLIQLEGALVIVGHVGAASFVSRAASLAEVLFFRVFLEDVGLRALN